MRAFARAWASSPRQGAIPARLRLKSSMPFELRPTLPGQHSLVYESTAATFVQAPG